MRTCYLAFWLRRDVIKEEEEEEEDFSISGNSRSDFRNHVCVNSLLVGTLRMLILVWHHYYLQTCRVGWSKQVEAWKQIGQLIESGERSWIEVVDNTCVGS